ncbi:MAG: hypothetical protein P8X64_01685 [Anaerolineales bacterium]
MDIVLPVGSSRLQPGPLDRFLPPVEVGTVERTLELYLQDAERLLDPFGASPRLAMECARAGREVLVAVNNPVTRFVLRHTLKPFQVSDLQAALAQLAAIPKDETRLEPFILDLYRSHCSRCGEPVQVEYYVWDKELGGPSHKVFACERCGYAGESAATEDDWNQALDYSRRTLQHALALEQVAPAGDPDRKHAEAALAMYPGRAVFALITILNKLEQAPIEPRLKDAADALLLQAFDTANALWGHPEGRARPRQLVSSSRFREYNVWLALERAVDVWAAPDPGVQVRQWEDDDASRAGEVTIYSGSARELCQQPDALAGLDAILTVPPRPNQAYWTLSALWAGWLWGREEAAPIKVALRRRRYDWAWHATALRTVFSSVAEAFPVQRLSLVYFPEAEPGFIAAALAGVEGAGFSLQGRALRADEEQLLTQWVLPNRRPAEPELEHRARGMERAVIEVLSARAEPTPYSVLHAAVWSELAGTGRIERDWTNLLRHPVQALTDEFEQLLQKPSIVHLSRGSEPQSGLYSLRSTPEAEPLSDRVEREILAQLRNQRRVSSPELDQEICRIFTGLLTPDRRWVRACLQSYAEPSPEGDVWSLRQEDQPDKRAEDREDMLRLLRDLGLRLGFEVQMDGHLNWTETSGKTAYRFEVRETSAWGHPERTPGLEGLLFVVPGSRSGLIAERTRRNPEFRTWLESGVRVMKFRHVRRLLDETTLTRDNLAQRLAIDPPEHQDPQLPLL